MRRGTAKDALARLRHAPGEPAWETLLVVIRHHGAPSDERTIPGARITDLGTSFFEVDRETRIPYHRVRRIMAGGELRYDRSGSSEKTS